jgi:hypothetical protein
MKIDLIINDSRKFFNNLEDLRKYLLSFGDKKIPHIQSLFVDGRKISYFNLCYFVAHGHLPGGC